MRQQALYISHNRLLTQANKKNENCSFQPFVKSRIYSEKVNGIVTVVLPDLILLNIQRFTVFFTALSNSP